MTAALLLTIELARKLNGRCTQVHGGVLASDGQKHNDCSTCQAQCGPMSDLGMADTGFRISTDHESLRLNWDCPVCGAKVSEPTTLFAAGADAKNIASDPDCYRCRTHKQIKEPA